MKNKAVFLDRDGTINVDYGYVHDYEHFQYLDGAIEGLKMMKLKGYLLIIVTNQSGIARGFFSETDFLELHKRINEDLQKQGVKIDGLYYCPHLEGCTCRKPQLELFYRAAADFDLDLKSCCAVGDKERDLAICDAENVTGFLISESNEQVEGNYRNVKSLKEASELMV